MNTTLNKLADDVISKKNKMITDEVFLLIQNDRDLMQDYLELVRQHGVQTVNQHIGKAVKEKYRLENDDDREYEPVSTLIQSHQRFK